MNRAIFKVVTPGNHGHLWWSCPCGRTLTSGMFAVQVFDTEDEVYYQICETKTCACGAKAWIAKLFQMRHSAEKEMEESERQKWEDLNLIQVEAIL